MTRIVAAALLALAAFAPTAAAKNPWLFDSRSFINMAHQGGEDEFPSATMYAFKSALAAGADTLELDVNRTSDGELIAIHDTSVDRTTNGTGYTSELTLEAIQRLDAAYNFIPGRNAVSGEPESAYPFRGVRTGDKDPPSGFTPQDFRVPTITEVMETFPEIPLNFEIKGQNDDEAEFLRNAELLADLLKDTDRRDIIVTSFNQAAVDRFHELAPEIHLAPGVAGGARFLLQNESPGENVVAFQIPITFKLGDQVLDVATPENVLRAHRAGYAVHVWLSGDEENARVYNDLLDMCVDGIMPAKPKALEKVLKRRKVMRPGTPGFDPCGAQVEDAAIDDGTVDLVLRRRGVEPAAYTGRVQLRTRRGRLLGSGRFELGEDAAKTAMTLEMTDRGKRAVRRGTKIRGVLTTRTSGKRGLPIRQRVTLLP